MKQLIIILLAFTLTSNAQEVRKKCITITEEKLPNYKVKVVKTNYCVEPKEITIRSYVVTEWEKIKRKKRKQRKSRKNEK